MSLIPKDWNTFQHYKERKPPWIKLHRTILDNYDFACLPVASRALAPLLWLLASEYPDGEITASMEEIAFRVRMPVPDLIAAIEPLVKSKFFNSSNDVADCYQDASNALAECKQDAMPETERETERDRLFADANDTSNSPKKRKRTSEEYDPDFIEFYSDYPRKQSKKDAARAYAQVRTSGAQKETIARGLDRAKRNDSRFRDPKFTPLPASWLRAGGFDDEYGQPQNDWKQAVFS
jgi:hypothetical protein